MIAVFVPMLPEARVWGDGVGDGICGALVAPGIAGMTLCVAVNSMSVIDVAGVGSSVADAMSESFRLWDTESLQA